MNYQSHYNLLFLFILIINYSLALSYIDQDDDLVRDKFDEKASLKMLIDDDVKYRRQSEIVPTRINLNNRNKPKSRFLKYDFLLNRWTLHKTDH